MNFLLDENFPKAAAPWLEERGHDVIDLRGTADEGSDDTIVFEKAVAADAVILTTDRDFFHTLPALHETHPGVVVIALRQPNRARILLRLEWLITHVPLGHLKNRAIQLRDSTWLALPPMP